MIRADSRTVMVKVALRSASPVSMANLAEALRLAEHAGVPSPRLLWSGMAPESLGSRPILIQEFLPGIDGEEALESLDSKLRAQYFVSWGKAVGLLHSIAQPFFSNSISEPGRSLRSWDQQVAERLARLVPANLTAGVVTGMDLDRAAAEIEALASAVAGVVRPSLVHCDLYPPNTLVEGGRFIALLDFEHAKLMDPVYDFVKLGMWTFEAQIESEGPFLDGYRSAAKRTDAFDDRLRICIGLELLAGFPYWKSRQEPSLQNDYLDRFDRWLRHELPHPSAF